MPYSLFYAEQLLTKNRWQDNSSRHYSFHGVLTSGNFEGRPISGRVILFAAVFFVLCGSIFELGNVSLSNFKAKRFVHRCFNVRFDLYYHRREFFLALLPRFGVNVMALPLATSISRTVPALEEVIAYRHSQAACVFQQISRTLFIHLDKKLNIV